MSRSTSFFLDLLRLMAAGMVFADHVILLFYPSQGEGRVGVLGHRAVIVFFVLSGYVIAYSTFRKALNAREYVMARLSRLYSVVLPALILTAALQTVGTWLNPGLYGQFERGHDALRYFLTAFFLQSLWTTNTCPPTNGPFWSLGYEFWYYAIFGAAVFIKPFRRKIFWVILLLAISGIDSFLLMPAWVAGVILYVYGRKNLLPRTWALAGAVAVLIATAWAMLDLPNWPKHYGHPPLFYSSAFLTDGLLALLLTALIGLVDQAFRSSEVNERLDAVVRWTADHTFSLYLYHFPLMLFVSAVVPVDRSSSMQMTGIIIMILAIVFLLSLVTEAPRARWRKFFGWCWDSAARRLARPRAAAA